MTKFHVWRVVTVRQLATVTLPKNSTKEDAEKAELRWKNVQLLDFDPNEIVVEPVSE